MSAMKPPNRKAALRHALKFIAAHPNGCTEAILAAEDIPATILIELFDGLRLAKAFMRVRSAMRRHIVALVNEIASEQ